MDGHVKKKKIPRTESCGSELIHWLVETDHFDPGLSDVIIILQWSFCLDSYSWIIWSHASSGMICAVFIPFDEWWSRFSVSFQFYRMSRRDNDGLDYCNDIDMDFQSTISSCDKCFTNLFKWSSNFVHAAEELVTFLQYTRTAVEIWSNWCSKACQQKHYKTEEVENENLKNWEWAIIVCPLARLLSWREERRPYQLRNIRTLQWNVWHTNRS